MAVTFLDVVAQEAHIGWGGLLCFMFRRWLEDWEAVLAVIVFALCKEVAEATGVAPWEAQQPWSNSGIDFLFFLVGIGLFLFFKRQREA